MRAKPGGPRAVRQGALVPVPAGGGRNFGRGSNAVPDLPPKFRLGFYANGPHLLINEKPAPLPLAGKSRYDAMFTKFFNSARLASTYKPVFLRSLLDVGDLADRSKRAKIVGREWLKFRRNGDRLFVDLNFIAVRFAKYYWDMEYRFKLRQSQDRQDANILKIIRGAQAARKKPPTIRALASTSMSEFRAQVIRKSIRPEVLVHLKTNMPSLYKKEKTGEISFNAKIVPYIKRNRTLLRNGLNYTIARYLEKINRGTPSIAKKVGYNSDSIVKPMLCPGAIKDMRRWQYSRCFYCGGNLRKHHVDHVIPFNFVFSTELYNCVLSCPGCNCKKSDTLPERSRFAKVVARNRKKLDYIQKQEIAYKEESYCLLFNTCVIQYNGKKFFRPR